MQARTLWILCLLFSGSVFADLESMKARVPKLVELKERGLIGEKRDGMVGVVKDGGDAASVVAAENKDRLEVYQARAKESGVALPTFMKVMGEERTKKESSGRFIQNEKGEWAKK